MKKLICIFLIYNIQFRINFCFSQTREIDSLIVLVKITKEDKVKAVLLYQLSEICEEEDILKFATQGFELAQKSHYKKLMANCANNIGYHYQNRSENNKSLEWHYKSLKFFEEINDKSGIAVTLTHISLIYFNQGNMPKALTGYIKSLKIYEEIKDKKNIANLLFYIARINDNQNNIFKALQGYTQSLKIFEEIKNIEGIANSLNSLASIYIKKNNYTKALELYAISLKKCQEIDDKLGVATILNNIAIIFTTQNNLDTAFQNLTKSLNINIEINNIKGISGTMVNIGEIYLLQKKYTKALKYGQQALELSNTVGYLVGTEEANKFLSNTFTTMKKYKDALRCYKGYILARDSISNKENTKKIIQTQMQYDFDMKEAATKLEQEKRDAISLAEVRKHRIILLLISCVLVFVIFFAAFAYRSYLQKQKSNIAIQQQKHLIEEKQKEILSSIRYAKRIQNALLPSTKFIERKLKELNKL